jgi:hypothetical protein
VIERKTKVDRDKSSRPGVVAAIVLAGIVIGVGGGYGALTLVSHRRIAANREMISDYLRSHPVAKLQIGAGTAGAPETIWVFPIG